MKKEVNTNFKSKEKIQFSDIIHGTGIFAEMRKPADFKPDGKLDTMQLEIDCVEAITIIIRMYANFRNAGFSEVQSTVRVRGIMLAQLDTSINGIHVDWARLFKPVEKADRTPDTPPIPDVLVDKDGNKIEIHKGNIQ